MHISKLLEARERGFLQSDKKENDLRSNAMDVAMNKLLSHSMHDTYPCPGSKSNEDYLEYHVPPFVSKFSLENGKEHVLAVASEEGEISVLNSNRSRSDALLKKFKAHDNAIFDICWAKNEPNFITASGDSTAALWDVTTCTKIAEFLGHRSSVKTVCFKPQNKFVFATGSRDGSIIVWDTRNQQTERGYHADNILRNVHQISNHEHTSRVKKQPKCSINDNVTAVIFQDEYNLISAGVGDGLIKMWDLRRSYCAYKNDPLPKCVLPYPGKSIKKIGYSSLVLDFSNCRLFASCTDNNIYEFNCNSFSTKPVATYHGHLNSTYFVKSALSPDGNYIISGSGDNNAYVWKVGVSGRAVFQLSGHTAEVTSVDWCQTGFPKIVTCSDDKTYRIWKIPTQMDSNEIQLKHGMVEKEQSQRNIEKHNLIEVPNAITSVTPARVTTLIQRKCFSSPLQDIQNINSSESTSSSYSSPTQDLPNSVFDRLHSPVVDNMCTKTNIRPRKLDWLSELKVRHQQQACIPHKRPMLVKRSTAFTKRRKSKSDIENVHGASRCLENYYK